MSTLADAITDYNSNLADIATKKQEILDLEEENLSTANKVEALTGGQFTYDGDLYIVSNGVIKVATTPSDYDGTETI